MSSEGVQALLAPRSIAIVGASDRPGSWPPLIWSNLQRFAYTGNVYPINPSRDEVWGIPCYPNITALPEVPDLVVAIVPADASLAILEEAGRAGVRAANLFSAGFGEGGDEQGRARAERLRQISQETGIRVCGPNVMGNISCRARAVTLANAYMQHIEIGPVALVGQSGGILMSMHRALDDRGIGISHLVMSGNELDLALADYIHYFADDADTRVIATFVESIREPEAFLGACSYARSRGKPVVGIKVGSSQRGREAALVHTGSLAGSAAVFDAVAGDYGVIPVGTFDDLIEVTELALHATPRPRGPRVGVIVASGGLKSLILDLAEREGVDLPNPSPETFAAMRETVGVGASPGNPLDHGAGAVAGETYLRCVELMMGEDNVDYVLLQGELPRSAQVKNRNFEQISELAPTFPKPLAYFGMTSYSVTDHGRSYRKEIPNLALLHGADKALRAAKAVGGYYARLAQVEGAGGHPLAQPSPFSPASGTVLDEQTTKQVLARYGLQMPKERFAASADLAISTAQEIGFPVVLKVVADGVTHKTDIGGVRLGLANEAAVGQAFDAIRSALAARAPNAAFRGVLVGEQVRPGLEVILAIQRDADMGVVLMLGLGGTTVELARRVSFCRPPVGAGRAETLIEDAGLSLLLGGYRGGPPLDRSALVRAILSLSALAQDAGGEIQTLEINPLAVLEGDSGVRVLDAVAVLASPDFASQ